LTEIRHCRTFMFAYTVIETPVYSGKVTRILTEDEREAFAVFIAQNPRAVRLCGVQEVYEKCAGPEKEVGKRQCSSYLFQPSGQW
jgi:hypothetical protein